MRILWLNTNLLLPLDKEAKVRSWHLIRHLGERHAITCIAFTEPKALEPGHDGISSVCSELVAVPRRDRQRERFGSVGVLARNLFTGLPYPMAWYRSRRYKRAVTATLSRGSFDRIVCDSIVPAINLPRRLPCPAALFVQTVEAEVWRRHGNEVVNGRLRRWLYERQSRRMRRFERRTVSRFDRVLAVSDADRDTLERLYGDWLSTPIAVIPTGVDAKYFAPRPPSDHTTRRLVFTGSMDWLPNTDGVRYFCREILPLIREREPDITFTIVGRSPTPLIRRLSDDRGIEVTGRVEDVRPYLANATVYVVPLRSGGGARLKIFEAMAAGRAVVSTSVGAAGLPAENGRHLLVADTPQAFADAVVRLLRDAPFRISLEQAGRALVTDGYDWSAAAAHLEAALLDTRMPGREPIRDAAASFP